MTTSYVAHHNITNALDAARLAHFTETIPGTDRQVVRVYTTDGIGAVQAALDAAGLPADQRVEVVPNVIAPSIYDVEVDGDDEQPDGPYWAPAGADY